jgi:hypothetical protein
MTLTCLHEIPRRNISQQLADAEGGHDHTELVGRDGELRHEQRHAGDDDAHGNACEAEAVDRWGVGE